MLTGVLNVLQQNISHVQLLCLQYMPYDLSMFAKQRDTACTNKGLQMHTFKVSLDDCQSQTPTSFIHNSFKRRETIHHIIPALFTAVSSLCYSKVICAGQCAEANSTYSKQPRDHTSTRSSMVHCDGTSNSSGALYGAVQCACNSTQYSLGLTD